MSAGSIELQHYRNRTQHNSSDSEPPNEDPYSNSDEECPDSGKEGYLVVVGLFFGCCVHLGLVNAIGAVQAYVSTHQLASVGSISVSWIFSVYLCLAYGIGVFIGPVFDKHGPFLLLLGSTGLVFGGLMGAASSTLVGQFIVSFMVMGVGSGIGITPLVSVINHWFFRKRGTCTGIATCGGSVGGLSFPIMLRLLYPKYGYTWAMRILAFTCLGCMLIALALVKERIRRKNEPENVLEMNSKWKKFVLRAKIFNLSHFKDIKFIYLIIGGFFAELSLILIVTYFATYAIAHGVKESTSYVLLTVWNATGIIGRAMPSLASDFWGKFNMNILMLAGLNIFTFVLWLPFGGNLKALFAYAALGGYFLASILTMLPACLAQITSVDQFGERYGLLLSIISIGNLVVVPIGASVIDNGTTENYRNFVILTGLMAFVGLFFWIMCRYTLVGFKINVRV